VNTCSTTVFSRTILLTIAIRVHLYRRTCSNTDPNFKQLVAFATQNFDTFEDQGSSLDDGGGRRRVDRNNLDQFYDYHYRRTRKPRVPLPDFD
jgi:hypothetical protein